MRHFIRPTALKLGITKRIGWHTFRHSYSTLLKANGADIKVMQELLRHASTRVTLDTYTQAVTPAKRAAQTAVVAQFFTAAKNDTGKAASGTWNKDGHSDGKCVPFCAYEFSVQQLQIVDSKLASPTGFEPVLPP